MSVQVLFVLLIALAVYGFLKLGEVSVRNSRKEGKAKSFHHAKKPIKADETLFTSDPLFKFPPTTQRDRLILFALAVYFLPSFAYLFRLLMYRYLLPYMIYFLIFAALWLATIINKIRVKLALSSSIFIFVLVNISWFFSISQPGTTLLSNITSLANMSALPQVLQIEHVNLGVRAAGIWLSEHGDMQRNPYLGTSKNTQNGCQLILFQALGKKFPVRGRCSTAFNTEQIKSFAQDKGEYFILDNDSVKYFPQLASIWKNPSLMLPYGFKPYYQDFAGLFQIYINSH
jgi:hypothetical protein